MSAGLPSPRAVVFDLDGTLVDSVIDLANAANRTREAFGLAPLPLEVVRGYIGDGARRLVRRSLDGVEGDELERALEMFRADYHSRCLENTLAYDGVADGLAALVQHGFPLAVCTNKPQAMAETVVDGLGLSRWLPVVVGARRGVELKPGPALLQLACEGLGVPAAEVWMVGDSPNDVGAAQAVGAVAVGVSWGLVPVEALRASGPDVVVDSFGGLVELVRGARGG